MFSFSVSAANTFQTVAGWLGGQKWPPSVYLAAGALLALLFSALLVLLLHRHSQQRRTQKRLQQTTNLFLGERQRANLVLQDLDVGVIAYNMSGVLLTSNPAAQVLLNVSEPPATMADFLRSYGQDNGIHANLLLDTGRASGLLNLGSRILRIRVKETWQNERKVGTLIVISDITDQEQEEKRRKEFVANVSHELKTPLTTITTYLESLLDWGLEEKSAVSVRKDITRIQDDAFRMKKLIDDLLLLSSIDSSGWHPHMETLDFDQVVRQTVDRMQVQAGEKDVRIDCFTVSRIPLVFVDRSAMERVVSNLVSNAIKYTEKGGEIKVYTSSISDLAIMKVSDSGLGIDSEHIEKIFNRFYRVDITGSRMYGGTGLGLSIAKELVEMHTGRISVNSELGIGTEFTVALPTARKAFRETLYAMLDDAPHTDPFHLSVSDHLIRQAKSWDLDLEAQNVRTRYNKKVLQDFIDQITSPDARDSDIPFESKMTRLSIDTEKADTE